MKKLLLAAVAASGLAATPAMAATEQTYTFDGTVAARCTISGAPLVNFGALTDANGVYTKGGEAKEAVDTEAYCNRAGTTAKVQRTNLVSANGASNGFTNVIPMSASLTTTQGASLVDASTLATPTSTSTGTIGLVGAFTGLKVTATLGTIGGDKLVAGTYNGSIIVTLTPTT